MIRGVQIAQRKIGVDHLVKIMDEWINANNLSLSSCFSDAGLYDIIAVKKVDANSGGASSLGF